MESIEPKLLPPGTVVLVETATQVFEFTTTKGGKLTINCGGKRCSGPQFMGFRGCMDKNGTIYADKIVNDCHLILTTTGGQFTSGCVKSASVRGDNYIYELWTNP